MLPAAPGASCCGPANLGRELGRQQGDQEEQAERRACDGLVQPLALRLDPEAIARLAEGGLHLPALHAPAQDLHGIPGLIGAGLRLRVKPVQGVAGQHPSERDCGHPAMAADSGGAADLNGAPLPTIPARHGNALSKRDRVGQLLGQVCQAPSLDPWAPDHNRQARRRWVIQGGVEPQAGDTGHATLAERYQQLQGREAAVAHHPQLAAGQPAAGLRHELPRPVRQLLVPSPALLAEALRGGQRCQERQCPHAPCPGDRSQEHDAKPAQAARFDEVAVAGPHGSAVDALSCDALAAPAPDRVIDPQHDRPGRRKGTGQQAEQAFDGATFLAYRSTTWSHCFVGRPAVGSRGLQPASTLSPIRYVARTLSRSKQ